MKKIKKAGAVLFAPVIVMFLFIASVQDAHAYAYYTTDEFNVTFDVHEDNSVSVTEEIKIDAFGNGHGIYRYIPLRHYIHTSLYTPILFHRQTLSAY